MIFPVTGILPTRRHEDIADFLTDIFREQVKLFELSYRVSGRIVIRTLTEEGREQGRHRVHLKFADEVGAKGPSPLPITSFPQHIYKNGMHPSSSRC